MRHRLKALYWRFRVRNYRWLIVGNELTFNISPRRGWHVVAMWGGTDYYGDRHDYISAPTQDFPLPNGTFDECRVYINGAKVRAA